MRDVTLLWALRSACNLGCTYCYFGTIEEHRASPPAGAGTLSHLSPDDLAITDIEAFAGTLPGSAVKRIFIAGGEPLIWPRTLDIAAMIKAAGIQVVLCTNGIPLNGRISPSGSSASALTRCRCPWTHPTRRTTITTARPAITSMVTRMWSLAPAGSLPSGPAGPARAWASTWSSPGATSSR